MSYKAINSGRKGEYILFSDLLHNLKPGKKPTIGDLESFLKHSWVGQDLRYREGDGGRLLLQREDCTEYFRRLENELKWYNSIKPLAERSGWKLEAMLDYIQAEHQRIKKSNVFNIQSDLLKDMNVLGLENPNKFEMLIHKNDEGVFVVRLKEAKQKLKG